MAKFMGEQADNDEKHDLVEQDASVRERSTCSTCWPHIRTVYTLLAVSTLFSLCTCGYLQYELSQLRRDIEEQRLDVYRHEAARNAVVEFVASPDDASEIRESEADGPINYSDNSDVQVDGLVDKESHGGEIKISVDEAATRVRRDTETLNESKPRRHNKDRKSRRNGRTRLPRDKDISKLPSLIQGPAPGAPDRVGSGSPPDDWVWLTSYSRIPVFALQEFCSATRDYCPAAAAALPGPPGEPGSKGDSGETGTAGAPGEKGEKGDTGHGSTSSIDRPVQGPPGPAGPQGPPGLDGIPGEPGMNGTEGPRGRRGKVGPKGDAGDLSGVDTTNCTCPSVDGLPGLPGPVGMPGPKGQKGDSGSANLLAETTAEPTTTTTTTPATTTPAPSIDPRTDDCRIRMVGKPLFQRYTGTYWGAWMRDPSPIDGYMEKIWYTRHFNGNMVFEYDSHIEYRQDKFSTVHELLELYFGTGHVIFRGALYYHRAGYGEIVKYDLVNRTITATRSLHNAAYKGSRDFVYDTQYNYFDFAVDENGLWVIYNAENEPANILVSKIHPSDLQVERTWNISVSHRQYGNGFITCGVLYLVKETRAKSTVIDFAYDLYTNEVIPDIRLKFTNPFQMNNMISYNPSDRKIYSWDMGNQLTYPLLI